MQLYFDLEYHGLSRDRGRLKIESGLGRAETENFEQV